MNADEWTRIRSLRAEGETIKGIARRLGMSRNTVRRALSLDAPPQDRRGARSTLYSVHEQDIKRLLVDDPTLSVSSLAAALEWQHAPSTLAKYAARARAELTDPGSGEERASAPPETVAKSPTPEAESGSLHASLPRYANTFIGRRTELARLRGLLGEHRLITISGPGGIGKTRLATHLALDVRRAFPDGVRFVSLAGFGSPELISQAILEGLHLPGRDQHGATGEAALLDYLSDRQMLLVIDNTEHLVDACAALVHLLLQGSSRLRILITSREVLALPEEFVFTLTPLPVPEDLPSGDHPSTQYAVTPMDTAMALFESRADAVLNGFVIDDSNRDAVRQMCERLDGLPLAIELACARLPVLSVAELGARLDHRLDLLTTGNRAGPVRHRSLAATLSWSHELCTPAQQILWKRASIFADGFDIATAEEVCADTGLPASQILDAITALVSKSILLRHEHDGSVRFRMLETIREYGQSHLTADESRALHLNLLDWIHRKVRELVAAWAGPDQVRINAWFRVNRANLRTALKWALDQDQDAEARTTAARIAAEPWFLWAGGFSVREHRLWLERVAAGVADTTSEGQALATMALVQTLQGDRDGALRSLDTAASRASDADDEGTVDFVAHTRGLMAYFAGDFDAAEPLLLDALARYEAREPRGGLRSALDVHLGMLYAFTGQSDRSESHYVAVQQRAMASGERWFRAYAEFGLGAIALANGDPPQAQRMALDGLSLIRDFDDEIGATLLLDLLGWAEAALGQAERASVLVGSAAKLWAMFGQQLYGSGHWVEMRERHTRMAVEQLGELRYRQLHDEGASMSVSDVIAFALEETRQPGDGQARPDALGQLTRREREVAELVTQGLSNRDIAARLVLSPRTVEGHVEHVLQKLALTSRTQIAMYLT